MCIYVLKHNKDLLLMFEMNFVDCVFIQVFSSLKLHRGKLRFHVKHVDEGLCLCVCVRVCPCLCVRVSVRVPLMRCHEMRSVLPLLGIARVRLSNHPLTQTSHLGPQRSPKQLRHHLTPKTFPAKVHGEDKRQQRYE